MADILLLRVIVFNLIILTEGIYEKNIENFYDDDSLLSCFYEEGIVRTLELNKVTSLVFNTGKGFESIKKEKHTDFGVLLCGVESEGIEPSSKQRISKLSTCLFPD